MDETHKGENIVWLLTDENPWGNHGSAPVENGKLLDGWEYHIREPFAANNQPSGWFVAAVEHVDPAHKPSPTDIDPRYTTYGFPLSVAFKTLEEARASACGYYNALRLYPGYPDVRDIISDISDT